MEKKERNSTGLESSSRRRFLFDITRIVAGSRFSRMLPVLSTLLPENIEAETITPLQKEKLHIQHTIAEELRKAQKYLNTLRNDYAIGWRSHLHKALCVGAWDLAGVYPTLQEEISEKGAGSPDAWRVSKNGNFKILHQEPGSEKWRRGNTVTYETPKSFVQWYKALEENPRKGDRHLLGFYKYSEAKHKVAKEMKKGNENIVPATHFLPMPGKRVFDHRNVIADISVKDFLISLQYKVTFQGREKERKTGRIKKLQAHPPELQDDLEKLLGEPGLLKYLKFTVNGEPIRDIHFVIPKGANVQFTDWTVMHYIHTDDNKHMGAVFHIMPFMGILLDSRIKQVAIVERKKGHTQSPEMRKLREKLRARK